MSKGRIDQSLRPGGKQQASLAVIGEGESRLLAEGIQGRKCRTVRLGILRNDKGDEGAAVMQRNGGFRPAYFGKVPHQSGTSFGSDDRLQETGRIGQQPTGVTRSVEIQDDSRIGRNRLQKTGRRGLDRPFLPGRIPLRIKGRHRPDQADEHDRQGRNGYNDTFPIHYQRLKNSALGVNHAPVGRKPLFRGRILVYKDNDYLSDCKASKAERTRSNGKEFTTSSNLPAIRSLHRFPTDPSWV